MIRNHLHISRDLPFRKCHRHQEPDAKGIRPVTVQFEKHGVKITTIHYTFSVSAVVRYTYWGASSTGRQDQVLDDSRERLINLPSLHLNHHQDRNAVLSKASDLVGTGIFISEDFPKLVLRKRTKLLKFAKEVIDKIYVHFDTNV